MLKNGNVRGVRFDTLEKICIVLDCQPGDLLEYQPYDSGKHDKENEFTIKVIKKTLFNKKNKEI